ncbi:MAG: hypothetical protein IJ071_07285 [Ruminococcus sp.]|nr:hypothetical protein [Ruminococcus sp.]
MKKLILAALLGAALTLTACGVDDTGAEPEPSEEESSEEISDEGSEQELDFEIPTQSDEEIVAEAKEYADEILSGDMTRALPLPESAEEIPDDWEEYSLESGISFYAPAGLNAKEGGTLVSFRDTDEDTLPTVGITGGFEYDWSEESETYEEDDLYINAIFEAAGLSGTEDEVLYQPLRDLGYDVDTRYGYTKALLTVTDEEMKSLGEDGEKSIRLANGLVYSPFGSDAYIFEKENSHVFIMGYGEGLWVDLLPSEDLVYSFVVKCEDKDTQMKIAASFDMKESS